MSPMLLEVEVGMARDKHRQVRKVSITASHKGPCVSQKQDEIHPTGDEEARKKSGEGSNSFIRRTQRVKWEAYKKALSTKQSG